MMRWRANYKRQYFYITSSFEVDFTSEDNTRTDERMYESGNYFKTKEEAEEVAMKLRAILKEHHQSKEGGQQ